MADFPSSVKAFATLVDLADSVLAAHQNDRGDEITAIETWLLAGWLGTVRTTIDGLKLAWDSATSITVGVGACFAENGDFIDVSSALTLSSLSLSASTMYHVYVYLNSGTPAAEVVTTAPTAWKGTAYSKTGDTSRRYVGSVLTDGSSNVYEFRHNAANNLMMYYVALNAAPFRVLSGGTATSTTSVSVSGAAPSTAISIALSLFNSGTAFSQLLTAGGSLMLAVQTPGTGLQSRLTTAQHPLDGSDIYYNVSSGGNLTIDVLGYSFER